MKKHVLYAVMVLFVFSITCAFAAEFQKSDSSRIKNEVLLQKTVSDKPSRDVNTGKTVPFNSRKIDPDVAKLAHATLPKVVYPTMTHHLGYDGAKFAITVRFNTDMDRNSVIAGVNVILDFPKAANEPGEITWINDREFKWVQKSGRRLDICKYDPDCEFKITLTDSILSKEGLKLDGDNDNKQGGTFSLWFIDLG